MRRIKIFDTTLRDGEQSPGCSMNLSEKIEMARQLDALGVDVIEAGFAIASPMDLKSVQAIAAAVNDCTVASLARCTKGDIDAAWEAVQNAKHPRIHVFLATSDIHMEYKLRMTREQVLDRISKMVAYAKAKCPDIEFSAEDASRSDRAFLAQCYTNAVAAGATTLNVPDTVGYSTPQEMSDLIAYLRAHVAGIDQVDISVHCHDDLGMAVANSLACVEAGAAQVECTVNGIGERAGNASLEEIVMAIRTRADFYDAETGINTRQIYKSSKLLSNITGVPIPPSKAIVGANAFAHESGIHQHGVIANAQTYEIMNSADVGVPKHTMVLGKHSGKHALREKLESMGYELTEEELDAVFTPLQGSGGQEKAHHHLRPGGSGAPPPSGQRRRVLPAGQPRHQRRGRRTQHLLRPPGAGRQDPGGGGHRLRPDRRLVQGHQPHAGHGHQAGQLQPQRRHRRRGRHRRGGGPGFRWKGRCLYRYWALYGHHRILHPSLCERHQQAHRSHRLRERNESQWE